MAGGNKKLEKVKRLADSEKLKCTCCGEELSAREFYNSDSVLYKNTGKIPYCKECINNFYHDYLNQYKILGYSSPEKKAIERICMIFDMYYSDKVFDAATNEMKKLISNDTPIIFLYIKHINMYQYRTKNYNTTINDRYLEAKDKESVLTVYTDEDKYKDETVRASMKLFGKGFEDDEYVYLYEQYCDWTSRHECNTKAQEEVFKNICLTQLQLLKATRAKEDTKDLAVQLQKWLDTGKLQPKQNSSDTLSDAQTFGTLIDKWETTRPLPEIDDELKDVDKIGLYIDVFFRGHLSKMMNLKNTLSDLYDKYMAKYTVEKPEYDADEDDEAMFEAIFGRDLEDEV